MNMNPVFKRESRISARSLRLPLILVVFNSILALVALLNMYSTLAQVRLTATIQYSSFLDLYVFIAIMEFIMLLLIMPAITAGSISGERERQTLEIMLATRMTPAQIVLGKLASAGGTMLMLIFSTFPILAMVFVYGGITGKDILMMLFCFITIAIFVGSIGIFCSAISKKTTTATVATYVIEALLIGGTYVINQVVVSLSQIEVGNIAGTVNNSADPGAAIYLLLVNPSLTFINMLRGVAGAEQLAEVMAGWFNSRGGNVITDNWMIVSLIVQWLAAVFLVLLAIYQMDPRKKRR